MGVCRGHEGQVSCLDWSQHEGEEHAIVTSGSDSIVRVTYLREPELRA